MQQYHVHEHLVLKNLLQGADGENILYKNGVKFYSDDDIYTAVYSKQETKETNGTIKKTISKNIEEIYQFYVSDDNFFVRSKLNKNVEVTTTKDGKTSTITYKEERVNDFEVDFSIPTIDLIDLSNYTEEFIPDKN